MTFHPSTVEARPRSFHRFVSLLRAALVRCGLCALFLCAVSPALSQAQQSRGLHRPDLVP